jgi:hypothetical protein
MAMRRGGDVRGGRAVGRQVDANDGVVAVDRRAQTSAQQVAAGADDGAAAVAAARRVAKLAEHLQCGGAVLVAAQRAKSKRRVGAAQLVKVGVLHERRSAPAGRRRADSSAGRHKAIAVAVLEVARGALSLLRNFRSRGVRRDQERGDQRAQEHSAVPNDPTQQILALTG